MCFGKGLFETLSTQKLMSILGKFLDYFIGDFSPFFLFSLYGPLFIQILEFLAWPSNFLTFSLLFSIYLSFCSTFFTILSTLHSKLLYFSFYILLQYITQWTSMCLVCPWREAEVAQLGPKAPRHREGKDVNLVWATEL